MRRAVELVVPFRDIELAGSLHLPDGAPPVPAVVMLQGSGPADRDADGYFAPIRSTFLEAGLAVFSADKPGCGSSGGSWLEHGLDDRLDQALEMLAAVRSHPDVDARRVGAWGQSQGGWLAQMLAAHPRGPAFSIVNSGPTITLPEQDLYGVEHTMRGDGAGEDAIAAAVRFVREVHRLARAGVDWATADAELFAPARGEPHYGYLAIDDDAGGEWQLVQRFLAEDHRPIECLRAARCPVLAVFGGRDVLLPAWTGAEETAAALAARPEPDAADLVVLFPDGDHRIRRGDGEFVAGYLDLLAQWAAARSRR